ncbi:MAG TPA: cupin domain-containing protein [Candidatus Sulfotelmatobacter sp.]|nr:cupin domain-containing protein [Candidatus Sulfotelmatobacter sp.]
MNWHKSVLLILLAMLPWSAGAQTKPAAKASAAAQPHGAIVVEPGTERWGDVPAAALVGKPSVEMGGTLKIAIIQGDPMTPGRTYTIRLSCTDGLKIAPHWHPKTENVTVVKGAAAVGMGSKWDDAALKEVGTGGFFSAAPEMRHYAQCKGDTILQVHGVAPFVVNFVSPDEGPTEKK